MIKPKWGVSYLKKCIISRWELVFWVPISIINDKEFQKVCILEEIWSHLSKSGKVTLIWNIINGWISCFLSPPKVSKKTLKRLPLGKAYDKLWATHHIEINQVRMDAGCCIFFLLIHSTSSAVVAFLLVLSCPSATCAPWHHFQPSVVFCKRIRHSPSPLPTCSFHEILFPNILSPVQSLM